MALCPETLKPGENPLGFNLGFMMQQAERDFSDGSVA